MIRNTKIITTLILAAGISASSSSISKATGFLGLSIGYYDTLDNDNAVDLRLEYRPDTTIILENLHPWVGAELTSDASFWAGGGLLYDWNIHENWHITPSFGIGYYAQGSSDLNLSHAIEFRSQIETAYEFKTGQRAGIALSHLSNLSFDNSNPGTEILSLYWHIPY